MTEFDKARWLEVRTWIEKVVEAFRYSWRKECSVTGGIGEEEADNLMARRSEMNDAFDQIGRIVFRFRQAQEILFKGHDKLCPGTPKCPDQDCPVYALATNRTDLPSPEDNLPERR